MENINVSKDRFEGFEKLIDERTVQIQKDVTSMKLDIVGIKDSITTLVTKEDLDNYEENLKTSTTRSIVIWVLGGVVVVLIGIISFFTLNPKVLE
ncbi:MAG: hypothetical protein GX038_06660 [Erysipelothrix sp.]|nr:hypothetical protein [Erysipelothrix sp.]